MNEEYNSVQSLEIDEDNQFQRIDNFLTSKLKGVPKSMIYRIVRKGEVRVNKKRVKPDYKLMIGDVVRVPPVRTTVKEQVNVNLNRVSTLESHIIFEDDRIIVFNKPSGLAVHGGSGLNFGVIEGLRALRPQHQFLELVHRLDRDTSGCLLIAKKRSALRDLHEQLRSRQVDKRYHALVVGEWPADCFKVLAPLQKNVLKSGERLVSVSDQGKASETRYRILQSYARSTLIEASPVTGRTHQIRVHCLHAGHPIAMDSKYGDDEFDAHLKKLKFNRLFLHAKSLSFRHPVSQDRLKFEADYDSALSKLLAKQSHEI
ncbi:23S rRNA pseudouridine(955/2504/2580) synthase RluC [Brumicola pallidula]|jgi:23S rRNA pseudouridine955/2504/2580 synthase|uniref:Pseudouridine synthase n=1 Tax=Brumicola pallidula DSM 14239 = ACAM 615 TaxID=1121922 RepID=K6ZF56_9ALTE|nr:23S rRNA pseudouridine(955/2504/2580) synthase RluC [Glaciecola pallidula]GAC28982.1 23S rRNA pseudouridine955/2504/2580 synthase [Glaciecola pallidula DSM 14239 = ACAM 615]